MQWRQPRHPWLVFIVQTLALDMLAGSAQWIMNLTPSRKALILRAILGVWASIVPKYIELYSLDFRTQEAMLRTGVFRK